MAELDDPSPKLKIVGAHPMSAFGARFSPDGRRIADDGWVWHPVGAVSVTGSVVTGRRVGTRCLRLGKPLQAELGGHNAAIVMPGARLEEDARQMALAAFSFGGQRCTAIRRFVVHRSLLEDFERTLAAAVEGLVVGDPREESTDVGPMIGPGARRSVATWR